MTSVEQKTATFVKRRDGAGDGRVYRLAPPLRISEYNWAESKDVETGKETEYIWISAVDVPFSGPETYIFACDADGQVEDYSELDGSYRGGLDHAEALRRAGYEVQS